MQAEDYQDSIRPGLVALLPRLKRFADLLAGEKKAGTALLGRALNRMLAGQHRYHRSTALDCFAFADIYRQWLDEFGDETGDTETDEASFATLFPTEEGEEFDPFTLSVLRSLPPQQRLTLLLIYGEGFDHIDAGRVLDVPPEAIATRLVSISAGLADRLSGRDRFASASVAALYADESTL